jgi:hypothetical protein
VEYFGHIVSHEDVKVGPNKIKVMMEWSIPKTSKNIMGYLGLMGCYRNFSKNYGPKLAPLTSLLKKDYFSCTQETTYDFEKFNEVVCRTLVLAMLNFTKNFIVECDSIEHGIGAIFLMFLTISIYSCFSLVRLYEYGSPTSYLIHSNISPY